MSAVELSGARIYIASKSKHGPRWLALRSTYNIVSTWIDECDDGATVDWPGLWERCITEAASCDLLIAYHEPGEEWKGAFVEIGAALAHRVPVFVFGEPPGSWLHHRLAATHRDFNASTVEELIDAACAWWAYA